MKNNKELISEIINAIVMMAAFPAPTQIIIRGPRAILGREFSTTTYGSVTRLRKSFHHNATAIKVPRAVDNRKLTTVSHNEANECVNSSPDEYSEAILFATLDGLEVINGSAHSR